MKTQSKRMTQVLHVTAAMLVSAALASAAIPGLCNTGLSNGSGVCTGPLVPAGNGTTNDANWQIATPSPTALSSDPIPNPCGAAYPCAPTMTFTPAWVDTPDASWLPNATHYTASASEWITPQIENNSGGYYVYSITFPVAVGATKVTIAGQLLSDNEVVAMYLSSCLECIPVAGYPYNSQPVNSSSNFTTPYTKFKITGPVCAAATGATSTATFYIVVRNRGVGGIDGNFTDTGLRVQFNQTASKFTP